MKSLLKTHPFHTCISIAAILLAWPLIWRQMPRMSFVLYPVILVGVSWATGAAVTKWLQWKPEAATINAKNTLFLVSCAGFALFTVWAATIPLELVGNLWRGNVLLSNLTLGALSLGAGLWAAYSIRLIGKSTSLETLGLVGGVALLLVIIVWSGVVYKLPDFSLIEHIGSSYIRVQYVLYGLLEATYWRLLFPLGFIAALALVMFGKKTD